MSRRVLWSLLEHARGLSCGEMPSCFLCGGPQGGWAPHFPDVCWKKFMMLLEGLYVCGGVSFPYPCTSRVDEGICVRVSGRRSARAASALPDCLILALKSARRLAISAARCSAKRYLSSRATLVLSLGCRT